MLRYILLCWAFSSDFKDMALNEDTTASAAKDDESES